MQETSDDILAVEAAIAALHLRHAAVDGNWNSRGADLMNAAELNAFLESTIALHEAAGSLMLAVGEYVARARAGAAPAAPTRQKLNGHRSA